MSTPDHVPTDSSTLPEELGVFCRDGRPRIVAVCARPGPERFALTTAVLGAMTSPGVVVATSAGASAYREFFELRSTHLAPRWTVLEGGNSEGGIRAVARALARAQDLRRLRG